MDTKRALIVVMVILLLMNIALASYILVETTGTREPGEDLLNTVEILRQRNIVLECRIPEIQVQGATVGLGKMVYGEEDISNLESAAGGEIISDDTGMFIFTNKADEPVIQGELNRSSAELAARDFIEAIGLDRSNFILDYLVEATTDSFELGYIATDGSGANYFSSGIQMTVTAYGVERAYINVLEKAGNPESSGSSLPVSTILMANLTAGGGSSSTVSDIRPGYLRETNYGDRAVMCWRVRFDDRSERFFDAGTGREVFPVLDKLKFNNIVLQCSYPEEQASPLKVVYGSRDINAGDFTRTPPAETGIFSLDDANDLITYSRFPGGDRIEVELVPDRATAIALGFINSLRLDPTGYYLDVVEEMENGAFKISYLYKGGGWPVHFGSIMDIEVNEYCVSAASIKSFAYTGIDNPDETTVPLGAILLNNLDIGSGKIHVITDILAGYRRTGDIEAVLCWRVKFSDGIVKYYSLETGQEIE